MYKGSLRSNRNGKSPGIQNESAFTLVELMVALALSGVAMVAIFRSFSAQQRVAITQGQVMEMQQELRGSLEVIVREIRMAGYDPQGMGLGFVSADTSALQFSMYNDDRGPSNPPTTDTISYRLTTGGLLQRQIQVNTKHPGGYQELAENIDVLNFVYLDAKGAVIATPVAATNLGKIRSVQIAIVARADKEDNYFINSTIYRNRQGTTILTAPGDGYRRRSLATTVQCQNMGLR